MGNKLRFIIMLLVLSLSATIAYANFDLDVDDDGKTDALTDGLLVIRYLFGFSGESLVAGAVSNDAARSKAADIEAYLKADKIQLDVDGDGEVTALTDGLLIIRSLFGFSGSSLSASAIGPNALRGDGPAVSTYLETITDSDNDNTNDAFDAFPNDPTEWLDTDGDGVGNNIDTDRDNGISVCDENANLCIKGVTVDGYISGATVFIDQNYNFLKDEGELWAVTDANGRFEIATDDLTLIECLKARPLIAEVPVGAIDSTRGAVAAAYQMILPSTTDSGAEQIVISPFTSLLSQSIVNGKAQSDLKQDLTLKQGCGPLGDTVANNVSKELENLFIAIQASFGISKAELLGDFMAASSMSMVTEEKAQKIADFYPYLKLITDAVNNELTTTYGEPITTDLALSEGATTAILENDAFDNLPLDFSTRWQTAEGSNGWYTEETIRAYGATISAEGFLNDYQCLGTAAECLSKDYSLVSIADASKKWLKIVRFQNSTGIDDYENHRIEFNIEDDRRSNTHSGVERRDCVKKEEIRLDYPTVINGWDKHFRFSTGHVNIGINTHECEPLYTGAKDLFLAINERRLLPEGGAEEIGIQFQNADITNSKLLKNNLTDPYTNRATINLKKFLDEVSSLPHTVGDLDVIKTRFDSGSGDQACIYFNTRDAENLITKSSNLCIWYQQDSEMYQDVYSARTTTYTDTGEVDVETQSEEIKGQAAIDAFKDDLRASVNFNDPAILEPTTYAPANLGP